MDAPTPIPCPFTSTAWSTRPEGPLVKAAIEYVTSYMANYDGSHDMSHIRRVVALSRYLHAVEPQTSPPRDPLTVLLAALMHDVGDHKYLQPGEQGNTLVRDWLITYDAGETLATRVQRICLGVSYSSEAKDPAKTAALVRELPELAVVQDADRLDALGAVGIGRCFMFSGSNGRSLADSMEHFVEKLEKLPGMMKTAAGKERAVRLGRVVEQLRLQFREETETFLEIIGSDGSLIRGKARAPVSATGEREMEVENRLQSGNPLMAYAPQLERITSENKSKDKDT